MHAVDCNVAQLLFWWAAPNRLAPEAKQEGANKAKEMNFCAPAQQMGKHSLNFNAVTLAMTQNTTKQALSREKTKKGIQHKRTARANAPDTTHTDQTISLTDARPVTLAAEKKCSK